MAKILKTLCRTGQMMHRKNFIQENSRNRRLAVCRNCPTCTDETGRTMNGGNKHEKDLAETLRSGASAAGRSPGSDDGRPENESEVLNMEKYIIFLK